jgi:copper chaperone CopZ
MIRAVYFHAIDGRIRIHIAQVKGSWMKAREITDGLGGWDGINNVAANPTTGNVLITYDSHRISQERILGILREMGYLEEHLFASPNLITQARGHSDWSTMLARVVVEALFSALV